MSESIRVIDDFLPPEVFQILASSLIEIEGYKCIDFAAHESEADGSRFSFGEENPNRNAKLHEATAMFILFENSANTAYDKVHFLNYYLREEIKVLHDALNVKKMNVMRAACTYAAQDNYRSAFHTDANAHPYEQKMKTAVLYLNSNNGGTQIKDGRFVQSKANRIVIFPWHQEHAGVWCTDKKLRFVLNLNYTEK